MEIGIIGLGNLGTALAHVAAGNGHRVSGWEFDKAVIGQINQEHCNRRYLPDITLADTVHATGDVMEVFERAQLVFITLPSRFISPVLGAVAGKLHSHPGIVNMSKGIDSNTGITAFETVSSLFPHHACAMLAGPSLANEFSAGVLTGLVAASKDGQLTATIKSVLGNSRFVVVSGDDPIGVELGGVLKNIYAMGMGLFDSDPKRGLNFVGAYLTRSLAEMVALGTALGAREQTFWQLSGIGDLVTTAMSEHSHNRRMGRLVAQGLTVQEIEQQMGVLPEGYHTLTAALALAQKQRVALPLAQLLHEVIHGDFVAQRFYDRFADILQQN